MVVADGYITQCDRMCLGMKWKMQGVEFQADVLILPIERSQMVLGIQWLVMLGPILWDFSKLRMEFTVRSKKVVLRGSPQPKLQLMSGKSLLKALQLPIEMCKVQLCSLMGKLVEQNKTVVSELVQDQLSELQQEQLNQLL